MTMEGNQSGKDEKEPIQTETEYKPKATRGSKGKQRSKVASTKGSVRSCSRIGNLDKKVPGELSGIDKTRSNFC